jgi:glycosyltransferase involved in cell wall biosynthesis
MPKLSIIIPTFNSAETMQQCLSSIACQTFTDYEVVIQDGESSDQTIELIREFQRNNPTISVELVSEPDKGINDAVNKAMRRVKGEWLYFLGSDDEMYDENVLAKMMSAPAVDSNDILSGNVQLVRAVDPQVNGTIVGGVINLRRVMTKSICLQMLFYRTALARRVGDFKIKYPIMADRDFTMRCWAKGGKYSYVDVMVAKYSCEGISSKVESDQRFRADLLPNIIRYFWKSLLSKELYDDVTPRKVLRAIGWSLRITR